MVYRCGITGESASDIPNFSSPRFCAGLIKTCTPGWATLRSRAFETKTETEIEYEYPGSSVNVPGTRRTWQKRRGREGRTRWTQRTAEDERAWTRFTGREFETKNETELIYETNTE